MHGARCTAHGAWCCGPAAARSRVSPESRLSRSKVQLLCVVLVRCGCLARAGFEGVGTGVGCGVRRAWAPCAVGRAAARARFSVFGMVFGVVFRILVDRSLVTRVPRVCECLSCMSSRSGTRSRSQERGGQVILTDQISDTSESETSDRDYLRAAHAFLKIIHISALHMLPVKTALYYTCHR